MAVEADSAQSAKGLAIPSSGYFNAGEKGVDKVRKRWRSQLAVSELVDGTWPVKKVLRDALYSPAPGSDLAFKDVDVSELDHSLLSFVFLPYGGIGLGQAMLALGSGGYFKNAALD